MVNHGKRWTAADDARIRQIANSLSTKQAMYAIAQTLSNQFGRTDKAVCKRIEDYKRSMGHKEWFWAQN